MTINTARRYHNWHTPTHTAKHTRTLHAHNIVTDSADASPHKATPHKAARPTPGSLCTQAGPSLPSRNGTPTCKATAALLEPSPLQPRTAERDHRGSYDTSPPGLAAGGRTPRRTERDTQAAQCQKRRHASGEGGRRCDCYHHRRPSKQNT